MNKTALAYMETFFTALADKTRLRILNLIRGEEVCVCFFTEVLGDSQPKISRHLAYLRNAGLVKARRDGKWMHYSIVPPADEGAHAVLNSLFEWMDSRPELLAEREKYVTTCCTPEALVQIAKTPMPFIEAPTPKPTPAAPQRRETPAEVSHNELEEFLL